MLVCTELRYSRGDDWEELKRRVEAVQKDLKNSNTGGSVTTWDRTNLCKFSEHNPGQMGISQYSVKYALLYIVLAPTLSHHLIIGLATVITMGAINYNVV